MDTERPEPRRYRKIGPESWTLVRAAYLSGLSAPTVAQRFGVTVSALRKRAARHGWTKQAHAFAAEARAPATPFEAPARPRTVDLRTGSLLKSALTEAAIATLQGKPYQARAYAQAGAMMAKVAELAEGYISLDRGEDADAGQTPPWIEEAITGLALKFAGQLLRGEALPPDYQRLQREWDALGKGVRGDGEGPA